MVALEKEIREEIAAQGPMRFDRFMELALYHPQHGYYARPDDRSITGRAGDYFTSVSVGPLFGRLLAAQGPQMWESLGRPRPFWILEQGAQDGQLAIDLLTWASGNAPEFFSALRYAMIEPLLHLQNRQQVRLEKQGCRAKVEWWENPPAFSGQKIAGLFLSNELVDAFPVRLVKFESGQWLERFINTGEGGWTDIYLPIEDALLAEAVTSLPALEGYTTEINLRARAWMGEVARVLDRGYVVTIDYGFPASSYYAPFRSAGTLTAYRRHRRAENILADVGEQDITAHVDFTALVQAGEAAGLKTLGLLDQQRFLMGIAEPELAGREKRSGIAENLAAWNTLTHPGHLGSRFLALVQARDAVGDLDCLRFARPGGWE